MNRQLNIKKDDIDLHLTAAGISSIKVNGLHKSAVTGPP